MGMAAAFPPQLPARTLIGSLVLTFQQTLKQLPQISFDVCGNTLREELRIALERVKKEATDGTVTSLVIVPSVTSVFAAFVD
jgi:hypothetical protein